MPGNNTVSNNYDGLLLPTSSQVKTANQQTTLNLQNTWGLNLELNKNQRTDNVNGKSSSKDSDFSYDDNQRLIQVKTDTGGLFGTNTESFTLDGIANRIKHNSESWTYNANSQLLQQGSTNYQYDDNGNTTQKNENGKITHYAYDTLNRLIQVSDSNNNLIAKYGYDVFNRRIWKEQYKDLNGADLTQAIRTIYLYADEGLIAEATQNIKLNADNSITASTSPIISSQYGIKPDNPFGTGVLFIKTKDKNQQETFAYYQHDQLGTPIQAIDKTGKVVWAADYNAFGQATITANQITSNLRLPGQYFDAETGLHYNWNRYYNPETGRYISSDPIGLAGGMNRYAYVLGNPTGLMDPMGLEELPVMNPLTGQEETSGGHVVFPGHESFDYQPNDNLDEGPRIEREAERMAEEIVEIPRAPPGLCCGGGSITKTIKPVTSTIEPAAPDSINSCNTEGSYRPDRTLPRDKYGNNIPDSEYPHSQIGTKSGRNGNYTQAREWDYDANGELKQKRDIDFTDHGRNHPNPHQHNRTYNGGTPSRDGHIPFER